jgi:hypothetical protein
MRQCALLAGLHALHPGWLQAWTPLLSDPALDQWVQDVESRAEVHAGALPSCCFFTFANSRQTLGCAAFSPNVALAAAGFADSSVRVYNVAQLGRTGATQGAKKGERVLHGVRGKPTHCSTPLHPGHCRAWERRQGRGASGSSRGCR